MQTLKEKIKEILIDFSGGPDWYLEREAFAQHVEVFADEIIKVLEKTELK